MRNPVLLGVTPSLSSHPRGALPREFLKIDFRGFLQVGKGFLDSPPWLAVPTSGHSATNQSSSLRITAVRTISTSPFVTRLLSILSRQQTPPARHRGGAQQLPATRRIEQVASWVLPHCFNQYNCHIRPEFYLTIVGRSIRWPGISCCGAATSQCKPALRRWRFAPCRFPI